MDSSLPPGALSHFADVYIRRAKAYSALGRTDAALSDLEEALERIGQGHPSRGAVLFDRGQLHF